MSLDGVKAVGDWPIPCNVKAVQVFLYCTNFYRRFIESFSQICQPLTDNLKKGVKFDWTEACQKAFEELKRQFSSEPILAHFNPDYNPKVETAARHFAKSRVLSELHSTDSKWQRLGFYSKKCSPSECNYDIR